MDRMSSIKDLDGWIASYKGRKQGALQMRPTDGALLVVDPKTPSKILKTFPVRRGYDLVSLLQRNQQLETVKKTLEELKPVQEERIALATEIYQRVEKELLEKVVERRNTADPMARIKLTQQVGELQREMETASEALQTAVTPVRYDIEAFYQNNMVRTVYSFPYTFEERSIPIPGKTA